MGDDLEQRIRTIFSNHYQDVYAFLIHFTGNQNDAEDLTQEVFARLLQALPRYDGRVAMKTWLFSIAKHVAIDQYRKQKIKEFFSESWLRSIATKDDLPEASLSNKENMRELKQVLQQLKPHYRLVVILRCIEEYSVSETAQILGISEGKVKVDTHRALKRMKKIMGDSLEGGLQREWA